MIPTRRGVSLLELIIVLTIIATLLALLMPAVQSARQSSRDMVCKNNVHQIHLAVSRYFGVHRRPPPPAEPGKVGGWMVEILDFIEQRNLAPAISVGTEIDAPAAALWRIPPIYRCPVRDAIDSDQPDSGQLSHYVLTVPNPEVFYVFDAPVSLRQSWLSGPTLDYQTARHAVGPHNGGCFYSGSSQGVGLMINGADVR